MNRDLINRQRRNVRPFGIAFGVIAALTVALMLMSTGSEMAFAIGLGICILLGIALLIGAFVFIILAVRK